MLDPLNPVGGTINSDRIHLTPPMNTPKAEVASMLKSLPEDSTLEDIQYHLYVLEKVKKGLERAEKEGTIPHEQAKQRMKKWLSN